MTTPQDLVDAGLAAAARHPLGPLGAALLVEESWTVNLRWASNGLTTNGHTVARTVTAVVAVAAPGPASLGMKVAAVTWSAKDVADVRRLVDAAAAAAAAGAPAEDAQEFVTGGVEPGWSDPAGETGPARLHDLTAGLGEVLARGRATGREAFGYAFHRVATTWLGTSGGLRYRVQQPTGTVELNLKAHARTRSAWAGRSTPDITAVDVLGMEADLARRLDWQATRVPLPPGRYDAVLPPSAVADLMIYLYWSAGARAAAEGRSVFSAPPGSAPPGSAPPGPAPPGSAGATRLGERLSDVPLTLGSDPGDADLGCTERVLAAASSPVASVFDNGLPVPATRWIDGGVLRALPGTRHTAALTGVPLAPAAGNLTMSAPGGAGTALDLAGDVAEGLLLTCLWYIREVDPQTLLLTGLTRDGVYVVRGGEVVGATSNFRFNTSPVDLLARVTAVGAPEVTLPREWSDWFTRARMPALRVAELNLTSASEAS